jgi:hypothetical protein
VAEYFLYDPTADYLRPPLAGYRLTSDGYEPIVADAAGRLFSTELALWLQLEDGELVLYDAQTGARLLTEAEDERAGREAERAVLEAERAAREAAEAEVERLREALRFRDRSMQ